MKKTNTIIRTILSLTAGVAGLVGCGGEPVFDGVMTAKASSALTTANDDGNLEAPAESAQPTAVVVWTVGDVLEGDHKHIVASVTPLENGQDLENIRIDIPETPPEEVLTTTLEGNYFASGLIMLLDHNPGLGEANDLNHKQVLAVSEDVLFYLNDEVPLVSKDAVAMGGPQVEGYHLARIGAEVEGPEFEGPSLWLHSVNDTVSINRSDWDVFFSSEEMEEYDRCVARAYDSAVDCWNTCEDDAPSDEEVVERCGDIRDEAAASRCFEDAHSPHAECNVVCGAQLTNEEEAC